MTEAERIFRQCYALHLAKWLERNGVSQAEFAKALGVHPSTLNLWKKGKRMPNAYHATRIRALMARWPGRKRNGQVE